MTRMHNMVSWIISRTKIATATFLENPSMFFEYLFFQIKKYFINPNKQNLDDLSIRIFNSAKDYTTTGLQRVDALVTAVRYIVQNEIVGDIVECGVWKGGSIIAVIKTLQELGCSDRDIYLFDTFAGMRVSAKTPENPLLKPILAR